MRENHVMYTDVRHLASNSSLWTSVVFNSADEINQLIAALVALRDSEDDPEAHFHLQYYDFPKNCTAERGEIMFHGPASSQGTLISDRDELGEQARKLIVSSLGCN